MFYWGNGNGSCDCNRSLAFSGLIHDQQATALGLDENTCLGAERFLIIDLEGDFQSRPRDEALIEVNSDYPQVLIDKFVK
jgi:hypothetical protein